MLPSRVTGTFSALTLFWSLQAPEPHPSIALTLVFPGLDWHSPYFGRGGLFLDYAGSPLINLQARWTEKRVSAPGKYTKQSHPPCVYSPGSLTLHGSKILALHASQSLQSLPLPRPAMSPTQSRELPKLLCSNIRTSGYARPRQATPPSPLLCQPSALTSQVTCSWQPLPLGDKLAPGFWPGRRALRSDSALLLRVGPRAAFKPELGSHGTGRRKLSPKMEGS